jgi:hypothetical protein
MGEELQIRQSHFLVLFSEFEEETLMMLKRM